MKAIVLMGPRIIKEMNVDKPRIGPHEVLIKVKVVGICGSDLHMYRFLWLNRWQAFTMRLGAWLISHTSWLKRRAAQRTLRSSRTSTTGRGTLIQRIRDSVGVFPWFLILGHEFSGIIEAVGEEVSSIDLGQRVCVTPNISCHKCEACNVGYENLCVRDTELGSGWVQGAMAEYVKIPAENVVDIPPKFSFEEAAISDCVAAALHAVNIAQVKRGHTVAILGAGTIGLLVLQILRLFGLKSIAITGVHDFNLDVAKKFGAEFAFNASQVDICKGIKEALGPVDRVFECVGGSAPTLHQALEMVGYHGKTIVVGNFTAPQCIDMIRFRKKESTLIGCSRHTRSEHAHAVDMLIKGDVDVKTLITHSFPMSKIKEAFETALNKEKTRAIKVTVKL